MYLNKVSFNDPKRSQTQDLQVIAKILENLDMVVTVNKDSSGLTEVNAIGKTKEDMIDTFEKIAIKYEVSFTLDYMEEEWDFYRWVNCNKNGIIHMTSQEGFYDVDWNVSEGHALEKSLQTELF